MSHLIQVDSGPNVPHEFNVVIEIPQQSDPIKYEVDKKTGALYVDRFLGTAMHYPCNYGYIPKTLCGDGDPLDVLVVAPYPLLIGSIIRCRAIGLLNMEDEAGFDAKILAVPIHKISPLYAHIKTWRDLYTDGIVHFFEHYKDLEADKWVKVRGWKEPQEAQQEILNSVAAFQSDGSQE